MEDGAWWRILSLAVRAHLSRARNTSLQSARIMREMNDAGADDLLL